MAKRLTVMAVLLVAGCFTSDDETMRTVEAQGFTEVRLGGAAPFRCDGKSDKVGQHFSAVNPAGRRVEGVVCCGVLKGCTVRF